MVLQTASLGPNGCKRHVIHRGIDVFTTRKKSASVLEPATRGPDCADAGGALFLSNSFFSHIAVEPVRRKSISRFVGLSECRSGFADGSGSRFWFRPSKNPPRGVSKQVSLEFRLSRRVSQSVKVARGALFVKGVFKHVHPAAVRRLPFVRILKCFCRRLRIAILVPTVKESTAGSP